MSEKLFGKLEDRRRTKVQMVKELYERCKENKWIHYCVYLFISVCVIYSIYSTTTGYMAGDSGIYFTFCRNFFQKPFSYANGMVSYGASSPFFCILLSVIYLIPWGNWFLNMKVFSIFLVVLSIFVCNKIIKGNIFTYVGMLGVLGLCKDYILYSSYVFETGLIGVSIAVLIYLLMNQKVRGAIYLCGILYLIRPELALVTAVIDLMILFFENDKGKNFIRMIVSAIPLLCYTAYMWYQTGSILPSSITGRALFATEGNKSILEKWKLCWINIKVSYKLIFIVLIVLSITYLVIKILTKKSFRIEYKKNLGYILAIFCCILFPHILFQKIPLLSSHYASLSLNYRT